MYHSTKLTSVFRNVQQYHSPTCILVPSTCKCRWDFCTVLLWDCGIGRNKFSTIVPLEYKCISIQVVLW